MKYETIYILELPPVFFLGGDGVIHRRVRYYFVDDIIPGVTLLDHAIDGAPIGQTTQIAIIDKHIDLKLARKVGIVIGGLLGIVAIDGIELQSTLTAPLYSLIEKLSLAYRPQDDAMTILAKHLQGIDGKGYLLAYLRVLMGYNSTVKIYCYKHRKMQKCKTTF